MNMNITPTREPRRLSRTATAIFTIFALFLAFAGGMRYQEARPVTGTDGSVFDGRVVNKPGNITRGEDVDFALFWKVWETLKKDYVDSKDLTDKKLFYGALQGLVASTGDPYTVFMNPEDATEFQSDLSGTFDGIGAEIGIRNGLLTIMAPLDDMPAMKAGVRAGDAILKIDGKSAADLSIEEAIRLIRGPKGTNVTLNLAREKVDKPFDITITRQTVIVKSIKTTWRESDGIYVIKVSNFSNDTRELFAKAVAEAQAKNPKGIILDLRNNPGGYLETAVAMASYWVEKGPIVSEQFSDGRKTDHEALGKAELSSVPTIVLINRGSASASEIVAGALKDYGKAKLIGEKSFGKGSVQILRELTDGSVVKVTTAKWLTPKGNNINEQGIEADIKVDYSPEDRDQKKDPPLDAAVSELLGKK